MRLGVRRPTSPKEAFIEEPRKSEHALQRAGQQAWTRLVDVGDNEESPIILDDDESESGDTWDTSSDSNIDVASPRLVDDLGGADSPEDDNIGKRLRLALVDQHSTIPSSPCENSSGEQSHSTLDILDENSEGEKQQQCQGVRREKERGHSNSGVDGGDNNQDSADSESPRPAERRRPSPSRRNPPSERTCKRRRPWDSCSRKSSTLEQNHSVLVQARPECASSLRCNNGGPSQSPTCSWGGEEPPAGARAEYQEWPIHGSLKRTIIREEIQYVIEFSLEQLHKLCAPACSQHTSPAGSAHIPTQAKTIKSGPPSQIKGTRFTQEEDARLVDMKEKKGCTWDEIEGTFPGRTRATLQVHHSTKLKNRASLSRKRQRATRRSR